MRNNPWTGSARLCKFTLLMLGVFSIILPFTACVVTAERDHSYHRELPSRTIDLQGIWFVSANDVPGTLEFSWTRNGWVGRIQFDREHPWEELVDIFFEDHTGKVQFVRPRYNQRYVGILSGNEISGTFIEGAASYPWFARKETAPSRTDLRSFEGIWSITANGVPGRLEFSWTRNGWVGRIQFDREHPWEELVDIFFEDHTGKVQFVRPRYNQRYVGILSGNEISGTFIEGAASYPWFAWRP
ncbi:MAG TPA: hypothetical protein VLZ10_06335 [Thermodesulfobacteriota bacterium]|nr:hypothetical protein [Thermodesulfobacteriota bacterium]